MAVKLLLRRNTIGNKYENDVISIRDASHEYTENELTKFRQIILETVEIDSRKINATIENVKIWRNSILPEMKSVYEENEKYYEDISAVSIRNPIRKIIWRNGLQWQELKRKPAALCRWNGAAFVENISRDLTNLTDSIIIETKIIEVAKIGTS